MQLAPLKPKQALNPAYRKIRPFRSEMERFKAALITLLDKIDEQESEEHVKTLIRDFLLEAHYRESHELNVHGRKDLVIHEGLSSRSPVAAIIEAKKPANVQQFPHDGNFNVKSFHELMLYYMRERLDNQNAHVRHLIITNGYEWYIFDASQFYEQFYRNKAFLNQYKHWAAGQLDSQKTEAFYRDVARPFLEKAAFTLKYTHFDMRSYEKPLRNKDLADDNRLIPLFKILAPQHLLRVPYAQDSNNLDKRFYHELLHILGLEEVKHKNKKVIQRRSEPDPGSLLESTIAVLEAENTLSRLPDRGRYGITPDEQLFQVALELCITWLNRILFLKLLEAQLLTYHGGDKRYAFLTFKQVNEYDVLNDLFFKVLARTPGERSPQITERYQDIPYLNSSLFEVADLEGRTTRISGLPDNAILPLYKRTVFDKSGPQYQKGELKTLEYLLEFLDAYDFTSEGGEKIQEERKSLINASVLGLIYEKINGYQDGSYFTPGYITEYMCRESIRKAVVQKFNAHYGWDCMSLDEVYNRIPADGIKEASELVDTMTICDPAVGSGHFLVSALNELLAVKSDLRILYDRQGRRLKEYTFKVRNDELVVTDENDDLFVYKPGHPESQRVQEALFHQKQTIIERCLFGVDYNLNSVKICRLRLWIELLKNAYYTKESDYQHLETLPNIDINIKHGNSLISRFTLDADVADLLKNSKWNIDSYRTAVQSYREARDSAVRREMQEFIETIKKDFESGIHRTDKRLVALSKLKGQLFNLSQEQLFDLPEKELQKRRKKSEDLQKKISVLEAELDEIRNNKIYENAFEWRFEFPEVLDEDGRFVGFNLIIGNPPYIRQEEFSPVKPYLEERFEVYAGTADLLVYFVERGINLLKNDGIFTFIISNKFMRARFGKPLRKWLLQYDILEMIDFGDLPVFEEATTYPLIIRVRKADPDPEFAAATVPELKSAEFEAYLRSISFISDQTRYSDDTWTLASKEQQALLSKLMKTGVPLAEYVDNKIFYGIKTGLNEAFVIDASKRDELISTDPHCAEIIKPFLGGRDIKRYQTPVAERFLILFPKGWTFDEFGHVSEESGFKRMSERYPAVADHLVAFKDGAKKRWDKGDFWWELRTCDYYGEFEKPKIIVPAISQFASCALDLDSNYCNDKTTIIGTDDLYVLGLLNSKLLDFIMHQISSTKRGGYYEYKPMYLEALRVVASVEDHMKSRMVQCVQSIMSVNSEDKQRYEREIDKTTYSIFNLGKTEIGLIEEYSAG